MDQAAIAAHFVVLIREVPSRPLTIFHLFISNWMEFGGAALGHAPLKITFRFFPGTLLQIGRICSCPSALFGPRCNRESSAMFPNDDRSPQKFAGQQVL